MIERRIRRLDQTPLSRSALLYLFADRQVRQSRLMSRAGGQPAVQSSAGRLLRLVDLEQWLVAWAVWELFDEGVVFNLSTDDRRRHASKAALWLSADVEPAPLHGTLSASLAPYLDSEPRSVEVLVGSWGEDRWPLPISAIVDLVGQEIVDGGLAHARSVPHLWQRWVLNRVVPSTACSDAVLSRLSGRFDEMRSTWRAFHRANPDEVDALFGGVSRGLRTARPTGIDAPGG